MTKKTDRATCQRCQRRLSIDELHVNNFDELLCEQCERAHPPRKLGPPSRGVSTDEEAEEVASLEDAAEVAMTGELVTIRRDELKALWRVVAAVQEARAEHIADRASPTEPLDRIWRALGELYRLRPSLRPSGE